MRNTAITIPLDSSDYPKLLAQISDPPEILYCRGNTELLHSWCLGIVGTRAITPYGRQATELIAYQLAARGTTIVSGLAMGVDAAAHQATLDAGGTTIAVLGSGIMNIRPTNNLRLANAILENNGLIVSEYPDMTPAAKHTFPARNRIISGLSHGIIVIEADKESGALITARCALDQNRDVFAVPGSIFSPRSAGTNFLLREGAKPVLSPTDILEEYGINASTRASEIECISTKDNVQKKILAILSKNGPTCADALIAELSADASSVLAALSILEIQNLIVRGGDGTHRLRT